MHAQSTKPAASACPVREKARDSPFYAAPSALSPSEAAAAAAPPPPQPSSGVLSRLNPLNYMFTTISQERAPGQVVDLPVEREVSSIPRGDSSTGNWEYPSPQQMYNALLRKGYTDTPQDAVQSMVAVHNFLNEGAWSEIVSWERIFRHGLRHGWELCRRGEENLAVELMRRSDNANDDGNNDQPRLVRFQGRPSELTPKAQLFQLLGRIYPAKFA